MYVCVYVCIHTCMYICMYVCYFPYSNTMSCNVCIVLFHSVNTNFDKRKLFKMNTYIRTHNHTLQTLYVLFAVILLTKWSVCLSVSDPFADTPLRRTPSHHRKNSKELWREYFMSSPSHNKKMQSPRMLCMYVFWGVDWSNAPIPHARIYAYLQHHVTAILRTHTYILTYLLTYLHTHTCRLFSIQS